MRLGPPTLRIKDIDGTLAFYTKLIGLRVARKATDPDDGLKVVELALASRPRARCSSSRTTPPPASPRMTSRASTTTRLSSPTGRAWRRRCWRSGRLGASTRASPTTR